MIPSKPNLFIVGAPKSGTTALAQFLGEHPDIFVTVPKEPAYWAMDLPRDISEKYGIFGWEDYIRLFSVQGSDTKYFAEASTCYLFSGVALREIYNFNSSARFIVMLRNPADMAYAFHTQILYGRHETVTSFEDAWRLQGSRAKGEHIPHTCRVPEFLQYGKVAALGTQLARAMSIIPQAQLYVGFQEDFLADPVAFYCSVLNWLGVKNDEREAFPLVNAAKAQRFPGLANWLHAPPRGLRPAVRFLRKISRKTAIGDTNVFTRLLSRPIRRESIRPKFRQELIEYFEPEIARIEQLTGRNLSHWRWAPGDSDGAS